MKTTVRTLRQIIREEVTRSLTEMPIDVKDLRALLRGEQPPPRESTPAGGKDEKKSGKKAGDDLDPLTISVRLHDAVGFAGWHAIDHKGQLGIPVGDSSVKEVIEELLKTEEGSSIAGFLKSTPIKKEGGIVYFPTVDYKDYSHADE